MGRSARFHGGGHQRHPHGGRVASILTGYELAPQGFRHLYIRAKEIKDEKALLNELKGKY